MAFAARVDVWAAPVDPVTCQIPNNKTATPERMAAEKFKRCLRTALSDVSASGLGNTRNKRDTQNLSHINFIRIG